MQRTFNTIHIEQTSLKKGLENVVGVLSEVLISVIVVLLALCPVGEGQTQGEVNINQLTDNSHNKFIDLKSLLYMLVSAFEQAFTLWMRKKPLGTRNINFFDL